MYFGTNIQFSISIRIHQAITEQRQIKEQNNTMLLQPLFTPGKKGKNKNNCTANWTILDCVFWKEFQKHSLADSYPVQASQLSLRGTAALCSTPSNHFMSVYYRFRGLYFFSMLLLYPSKKIHLKSKSLQRYCNFISIWNDSTVSGKRSCLRDGHLQQLNILILLF